jgi:hypothetical protein
LDPETTMVTEKCVEDIFWNILEVEKVNSDLCDALSKRQAKNKVVAHVGDIMLAHVANFEPFVRYGAHQIIGKYVFETEKTSNPAFDLFVKGVERLPVSRKLELNGYLTKPTTRLGRYNLLLREILKHTPKKHPDQETIPRVMSIIARFLADVNRETGKTENKFNLELLDQRLTNKNISNVVKYPILLLLLLFRAVADSVHRTWICWPQIEKLLLKEHGKRVLDPSHLTFLFICSITVY